MTHLHDDSHPYWLYQPQIRTGVAAILASLQGFGEEVPSPAPVPVLLQAVVVLGERVPAGQLITAVAVPWFDILEMMQRDPESIYRLDWRQWEEIIAGAYHRQGFEVVLTPRSNDKGRDVIATHRQLGSIRFYDQVKAYAPGHVVTLEKVHAMLGVLSSQPNVSKGVITTTATFAPGVLSDPGITQFIPYRLELKDRNALLPWLSSIAAGARHP
jgi:restriction system protein